MIIAVAAVALIVAATILLKNPLRKSQDEIQNMILSELPLGTSIDEVKSYIVKNGWDLEYEWEGKPSKAPEDQYPGVKGRHIIGAYLGHYQGLPWRVDIDAYWGFDSDNKLIDLRIRKMADAL